MKKFSMILALALAVSVLAGCAGTPVVYQTNCTCPTGSHAETQPATEATTEVSPVEGAVKTGLAVITGVSESKAAAGEENGEAKYDVTLVAVTVDDEGVITSCAIDSVGTSVTFDAAGAITSDLNAEILSKNELGENYGMKAYGGAKYEWNEQAAAVAKFAVGKTAEQLKNGAVDETGHAADADLASTATIYIGGYVNGIIAAAENAKHLGAQAGDELKLASTSSVAKTAAATAEAAGNAQLDTTVTALTVRDGVITSCYIDAVQAKVAFDNTGAITSDTAAPVQTKNQLGEAYGMVAWGGAIAEWDAQAAAFASYITGMTADQVAGIAITETTAPAEADLATSVTISIGGFQNLIAKAMQK